MPYSCWETTVLSRSTHEPTARSPSATWSAASSSSSDRGAQQARHRWGADPKVFKRYVEDMAVKVSSTTVQTGVNHGYNDHRQQSPARLSAQQNDEGEDGRDSDRPRHGRPAAPDGPGD